MAKPPVEDAAQEALFREVDDDLRQERMTTLWKQYGSYVIALAVLIVLIVAGAQGWKAWQASERQAAATQFEAALSALDNGQADQAITQLTDIARENSSGFAALAALQSGAVLVQNDRLDAALAAWEEAAANTSFPQQFRDAARMLTALHGIEQMDAAALQDVLGPLRSSSSPWWPMAEELIALGELKDGNLDRAIEGLRTLYVDVSVPFSQKQRLRALLAALGVDADAIETPAAPAPVSAVETDTDGGSDEESSGGY